MFSGQGNNTVENAKLKAIERKVDDGNLRNFPQWKFLNFVVSL